MAIKTEIIAKLNQNHAWKHSSVTVVECPYCIEWRQRQFQWCRSLIPAYSFPPVSLPDQLGQPSLCRGLSSWRTAACAPERGGRCGCWVPPAVPTLQSRRAWCGAIWWKCSEGRPHLRWKGHEDATSGRGQPHFQAPPSENRDVQDGGERTYRFTRVHTSVKYST